MRRHAIRKGALLSWGILPQTPWDLTLYGKNGRFGSSLPGPLSASRWSGPATPETAWGDGAFPSPPFPRLSRRSGRIPALPYPPLSWDQYSRATPTMPGPAVKERFQDDSACDPSTLTNNPDLPGISLLAAKNGLDLGVHFKVTPNT